MTEQPEPGPVGAVTRRILLANLGAQVGIVVTGGLVRLTGSGLGCPTWPQCTPGSLTPTASQIEGFHKYIEFGNRLLTIVLVVVAGASLVAVLLQRPRRRPLVLLAAAGVLGILGQAVLGGITVLTGLHPLTVAGHFLLSIGLITAATVLVWRSGESGDGPPRSLVRDEVRWLGRLIVGVALTVVVVGTLVTGSGPHAGDADLVVRLPFDPRTVAWLHADLVIGFLGLTVGMLVALRVTDAPSRTRQATSVLFAVSLAQMLVGYVQWFTGLPEAVVALHLLGACLVWVAAVRLLLSLRVREAPPASAELLGTGRASPQTAVA